MRTRFTDYKSYADATLQNIFTPEEMKDVSRLQANYLQTALFESTATGKYQLRTLPVQAQCAPVYTITPLDFNKDGQQDLLLCGNMNKARLRPGKYDANYGVLLQNDGKGGFIYIDQQRSGFYLKGDVRSVLSINNMLLFGINRQSVEAYKVQDP
jgi:hypothetical protein